MAREWKSGDVVLWEHGGSAGTSEVLMRRDGGWYASDGPLSDSLAGGLRPLVVIDPEDKKAVERLVQAHCRAYCCDPAPHQPEEVDIMQAVLREFANPTPPKPEEPSALYARVEDAEGRIWVRTATQASVWRRECVNSGGFRYLIPKDGCEDYDDVAAVRVLSEGVTP